MRRIAFGALAGLVLAALPAHAQDAPSFFDGADPDFDVAEGQYWLYPTQGGKTLTAWHSLDMQKWEKGPVLLSLDAISWLKDDNAPEHRLWAPDMLRVGSRYYFYYSVGPQNPTPSRIGVATCEGPAGPCKDSGKPLINDGGHGFEAIDPMVFVDPRSGKPYLYAGGSAGSTLRVWQLKPDMVSIDHEVKVKTPAHFTEGSFMFERKGTYYFSYSSGNFRDTTYSVHYATASSPVGPWKYRGAILVSDAKYKGPGHHAFLRDPKDGRWYIAYHRWEGQPHDGPYTGSRRTAITSVSFGKDGSILPIKMD